MVLIGEEAEADGKVGESSTDLTKASHDCTSILSFFQNSAFLAFFSPFGEVKSVKIIKERYSNQSKGFGFVEMASSDEGQLAIKELNGTTVEGRQIIVNEARPQKKRAGGKSSRRW